MENKKNNHFRFSLLFASIFAVFTSCEREISDEVEFATFPATGDIFTDDPIGLGTFFYFPYGPSPENPPGSKPTAWSVDNEVSYEGDASMRFDVPNADDPEGNFAGAIFRIDGEGSGRDLTGFDALTFWAKASQNVTINEMGFGEDFGENKYVTTRQNVPLTTNWVKYIIPIPDPSKLVRERGMFRYAAGSVNELGYTFWVDELRFEKLGTVAQPQPAIFSGQDLVQQTFNGSELNVTGITQTYNLANGVNQTVVAAPSYFTFSSSNPNAVQVSSLGEISVVGEGTAKVSALIAGVKAKGSLEITSTGNIVSAPTPQAPAAEVISLFSNQYDNVPVTTFRADFGNTEISDIAVNGDDFKLYSNLNFVGIQFPTIDATGKSSLFLDIYTNDVANGNFQVQVRDQGTNGELNTNIFTGQPIEDDAETRLDLSPSQLTPGQWITIEVPLTGGLTNQKSNISQIVFVGDIDFLMDNLYFR